MKKILLAILVICYNNLIAQESNQTYGIFFGYNRNIHLANFQKIPDVPNCCPKFEYGNGNGYNFGLLFEQKLDNSLSFISRLEYDNLSAVLSDLEPTKVILDNMRVDGEFDHVINSTITHYQLSLLGGYNPVHEFKIYGGFFVGKYSSADYSQYEKITKPQASATFLDSAGNDSFRRLRNEYSGSLKNIKSLSYGFHLGLSYDFPINQKRTLMLAPEVNYQIFLNDIADNVEWKLSAFRASLAIKYTPLEKAPKIPIFQKEYIIDTIKIENDAIAGNNYKPGVETLSSFAEENETQIITTDQIRRTDTLFQMKSFKLDGRITAIGVDIKGIEIANPKLKVEEFVSNRLDPLLNYIFFDENSADLPAKYSTIRQEDIAKFAVDSLYRENTIDIYYNLLNIIGKRMTENASANITIVGCNSNISNEKSNLDLSQKRAETVRDFLVNQWKISPKRIILEKRNLPSKASTPIDEPDKIAENRRVEIYSDNSGLLDPVFIEKIDRTTNLPIIRFKPEAYTDAGLAKWKVLSFQQSNIDNKFSANGDYYIPAKVDWELEKYQKVIPKLPEPIIYELYLEDKKGNKKTIKNQTQPLEIITIQKKRTERIGDYEIERYSLILFDFDKANIEGSNKNIVDLISKRIKPDSEIEISGYTDRTGDDEYNRKLSEKRAQATKTLLKRSDAIAIGVGKDKQLFNNDTPEGRIYSRTVEITVKTKVK
jgi:outer membrane protein OmpA-like peptidoglycan-associated protein